MSIRNELLEDIKNILQGGSTNAAVAYTEIGEFLTTATQAPTGTGSGGKIRVNFGAGGNTTGDEFTMQPDGTLVTLKNSRQYTFDILIRPSRTGAAGNSIIMSRFLYSADGTETDTVQIGNTSSIRIDDADTVWRESFSGTFSPAVGSSLWLELSRDAAGNNSGFLSADQPTGTLLTDTPPWNAIPSASITISTLSVVPS